MATERRMSWELRKLWSAGQYTLLADSYTAEDGLAYSRGDRRVPVPHVGADRGLGG